MTEGAVSSVPKSGLLIAGQTAVPLEGVTVEASVTALCSRVTISQRYRNRETQPVEAVYVFPLDEGAAVCGFEAVVGGVLYAAEALERDEAFKKYDEAMEAGFGAYLLDEERPDVFAASVGNLPPGGEVLIRLTYVAELSIEGDAVRFVLPTTVSPRYAPAADQVGVGRPDSEALNPPVAWSVPYGLSLSVVLDLPAPPTRVESPSHPISVALDGRRAVVTLATESAALDRDFVLVASPFPADEAVATIERDEKGRVAAVVAFRPSFRVDRAASEVVFVIDRSGSMGGSSIEQVRNALQLALRSLVPGCAFNVVGFGSTFQALFPGSRPYDEASLAAASAHAQGIDADLGGTEILPALTFVLERPPVAGLPRQVVILTDGEVTNTDAVLALVKKHAATARVFTFGIGHGASHHLVRGIARAGGGSAEFISPGERIEPKVLRQFARLLTPAVTSLSVDWGGMKVTQAPHALPPVFAGERTLVYGLFEEPGRGRVKLTGRANGRPFSREVLVDANSAAAGSIVGTLAARTLIRELEESPEWLLSRGSRQARKKEDRVKSEIIRLAIAYGLASRETSLVAVERRTPVTEPSVLRRVPIALTHGWGATDQVARHPMYAARLAAPTLAGHHDMLVLGAPPAAMFDAAETRVPEFSRASFERPDQAQGIPCLDEGGGAAQPERPLDRLVRLQRADGSWELTRELAEIIGVHRGELEAALGAAPAGERSVYAAWATALALAWLEINAPAEHGEWRLLAEKAERWLANHAPGRADHEDWQSAAHRFLARRP